MRANWCSAPLDVEPITQTGGRNLRTPLEACRRLWAKLADKFSKKISSLGRLSTGHRSDCYIRSNRTGRRGVHTIFSPMGLLRSRSRSGPFLFPEAVSRGCFTRLFREAVSRGYFPRLFREAASLFPEARIAKSSGEEVLGRYAREGERPHPVGSWWRLRAARRARTVGTPPTRRQSALTSLCLGSRNRSGASSCHPSTDPPAPRRSPGRT